MEIERARGNFSNDTEYCTNRLRWLVASNIFYPDAWNLKIYQVLYEMGKLHAIVRKLFAPMALRWDEGVNQIIQQGNLKVTTLKFSYGRRFSIHFLANWQKLD